jgi:hypothetical protein
MARLTPEMIEAFARVERARAAGRGVSDGEAKVAWGTLRTLLGLRPWHTAPTDVDPDGEPPSNAETAGWREACALRKQLLAAVKELETGAGEAAE